MMLEEEEEEREELDFESMLRGVELREFGILSSIITGIS
jgi:hypothetical protein